MQKHSVYVFYSDGNSVEAQQIIEDFKKANINCIGGAATEEKVAEIKQNENATGLIIVSDNYLKSIDETRYLEDLLDENHSNQLIPVLTHGRREKEGFPGQMEVYPTKIQTLNNVMYYRDFWYEEWIRLRKLSKTVIGDEQEELNIKKEIAKKMSVGSISTYIRRINNLQTIEWETFCADGYQVFFEKIGQGETPISERFSYNENGQNGTLEKSVEEVLPEVLIEEVEEVVEEPVNEVEPRYVESEEEIVEEESVEEVEEVVEEETIEEEASTLEVTEEELDEIVHHEAEEDVPVMEAILEETEAIIEEEVGEVVEEETIEEETPALDETEEVEMTEESNETEKSFEMGSLEDIEHIDEHAILDQYNIEEVTDIDILFHIAEAKAEEGEFENAKHSYERILKLDPYNGRALIWLARLLARHFDSHVMEAAHTYRKAIMVNDENASLYYEYALLQKDQFQSYNKASDSFREALDIDPMFEEAYLGLAQCQKEMGRADQAKANYLQACALDAERFQTAEHDSYFGVLRLIVEEEVEEEVDAAEMVEDEKPRSPNADTVVMITGATSGIGKSIAEEFIRNGYKVIITGRRNERLEAMRNDLVAELEEAYIHCLPFDVCDLEAVKAAMNNIPEDWANIDILINNAGLAKGFAPVQEGNVEHWESMLDTNVKGLLYMTRMVSPGMVERQKGHIINLSSAAGTQVYAGGGVYCASKAAVDSLTRSMRLDLYKHNIKVTSISPGHVDSTEFAAVRYDGSDKAKIYDDFKPLSAQDVADTVFYVASRPSHVNIQDILMFGTQQASVTDVNRSGRDDR